MAVQFAPKEESSAANLGSAVGKGLSGLIEKKIADLQKQHGIQERKATYKQAGLPQWLAELPDDMQKLFIKEYDFLPPEQKEQAKQQIDQLGQQYWSDWTPEGQEPQEQPTLPMQLQKPGLQLEQEQQPTEEQLGQARKMLQGAPLQGGVDAFVNEKKSTIPGLNSLAQAGAGMIKEPSQSENTQSFPSLGHGKNGQPGPMQAAQPQNYELPKISKDEQNILPRQLIPKATKRAEIAQQTALKKAELTEEKTLRTQKQKEDEAASKETKKYYDSILEKANEARDASTRLNKMERLVNEGGLPIAAFYSLFNRLEEAVPPQYGAPAGAGIGGVIGGIVGSAVPGVGTAIGAGVGSAIGTGIGGLISPVATMLKYGQRVTSPNTEEFEKLSNQFIRGAKSVFGSRITDADLKAYMSQIPTLANTDAGKRAIISDMKIANDAELIREKYMKQIIKENKGKRPADLAIQVEDRAKPELDLLAKRFINI